MKKQELIAKAYKIAKEQCASLEVNVDQIIEKMSQVVISLHCWQADDVIGFETPHATLSGGEYSGNRKLSWKSKLNF